MEQTDKNQEAQNQHFASKYFTEIDEASETDNYFIPVLKDVARYVDIKHAKILDVGCGTGIFMKSLVDAGCKDFCGIDGYSEFADRAVARGYKEVKIVADLNTSKIPYDDNQFDLVVCKDVFEHLLNPIHTLSEIHRVLKPEGLFLLHVPNHFPASARLRFLFSNNIDTFTFFKDESRWTFPHIRFYEYCDSLNIFNKQGFELIENLSVHFPVVPIIGRFGFMKSLNRFLVRTFPNHFAGGFTFLVRKKS
ncbi:MAG: methyltransferase domain-containing protein [Bacteroidia bacterium]|jgi:SAM-dependent methyltransferase